MPSLLNELIELAITSEDPSLLAEACLVLRCEGATIATIGLRQMAEVSDTKGSGFLQMGEASDTKGSGGLSCLAL